MPDVLPNRIDEAPAGAAPAAELFALIAAGDLAAATTSLARELSADALTRAARTLAAHALRGPAEFACVESLVRGGPGAVRLILAIDDAFVRGGHTGERRTWLRTAADLLEEPSTDWATRAGVWRRLAEVCLAQRDREGATRARTRQRELAEAWWAAVPAEPAARVEIAHAHLLAGDAAWRFERDASSAALAYRRCLDGLESPHGALEPRHAAALIFARASARLGDMGRAQGDLGAALAAYRRSLALCQQGAVANPAEMEWLSELARCHARMGDVMSDQHDPGSALLAHRQSLQLLERLHHGDVAHVAVERELAASYLKVGDVLLALGQPGGALAAFRHGAAIRARLAGARAAPAGAELRHELWVAHGKLADALERAGSDEAAHWWRQAYDLLAALKHAGHFNGDADEQFLVWFRHKAFPSCRAGGA